MFLFDGEGGLPPPDHDQGFFYITIVPYRIQVVSEYVVENSGFLATIQEKMDDKNLP